MYPFFSTPGLVLFPKIEFNFSKAPLVQITNLPKCPPGQSCNKLSLSTSQTSTPGIFLAAFLTLTLSLSYMIKGPFLFFYFLFLAFTTPVLIFLFFIFVSSSSSHLIDYKI